MTSVLVHCRAVPESQPDRGADTCSQPQSSQAFCPSGHDQSRQLLFFHWLTCLHRYWSTARFGEWLLCANFTFRQWEDNARLALRIRRKPCTHPKAQKQIGDGPKSLSLLFVMAACGSPWSMTEDRTKGWLATCTWASSAHLGPPDLRARQPTAATKFL